MPDEPLSKNTRVKKAVSKEGFIAMLCIVAFFGAFSYKLGAIKFIDSLFKLSFDLLINTCFYIMAIAVIAGALGALLSEFGILSIFNIILSPLMKPIYKLPGAAAIGLFTCFLSDNPAILTLCKDKRYSSMFKKYQMPAQTNLGTSFGMGLIVIAYMLSIQGHNTGLAVTAGFLGAVIGSIVSTNLMVRKTRKFYGDKAEEPAVAAPVTEVLPDEDPLKTRLVREGGIATRFIDALLEGGKSGVEIGLSIIPGVLIICSFVILLTNSPEDAIPGIAFFPFIGDKLSFIIKPLFGFSSSSCIAVPITALGSAGAAVGLVPELLAAGKCTVDDVAVFTAMCMCWSGYLSTHVAMMDSLNCRELTGAAISSHTIGGIAAGVSAHWLLVLLKLIF